MSDSENTTVWGRVAARLRLPIEAVRELDTLQPEIMIARSKESYAIPGDDPAVFPRHAEGSVRMADFGGAVESRYIDFLSVFDPATLTLVEAEQGIKQHPSYARYLAWSEAGHEPPYISVYETDAGTLQSTNRRRTLVAQALGKSIAGWLGLMNKETRLPLKYGDVKAALAEARAQMQLEVACDDQGRSIPKPDAFMAWFGASLVTAPEGHPMVVYRGEHGVERPWLDTRHGAISFGTIKAANLYAVSPNNRHDRDLQPRVMPAYVRIERPVMNRPDDPFIEMQDIENALGRVEAVRIARKFGDWVLNTNNWEEVSQETGAATVSDFLDRFPDQVNRLYFDAYGYLDDPEEVALLRNAGFDGAIHGGSGATSGDPEYKVFDATQVAPLLMAEWGSLDADREARKSALRQWFAGSKVVDLVGEPLRLFHGTSSDFDAFSAAHAEHSGARGFFFTANPEVASAYAKATPWEIENGSLDYPLGQQVMPVYLALRNPFVFDAGGECWTVVNEYAILMAKARGHDGAIIRNVKDGMDHASSGPETVYVAFESRQIKSALGNSRFEACSESLTDQAAIRRAPQIGR